MKVTVPDQQQAITLLRGTRSAAKRPAHTQTINGGFQYPEQMFLYSMIYICKRKVKFVN